MNAVAGFFAAVSPAQLRVGRDGFVAVAVDSEKYRGYLLSLWRVEEKGQISVFLVIVEYPELLAACRPVQGIVINAQNLAFKLAPFRNGTESLVGAGVDKHRPSA